ncbi:NepR family anti-sigma factor [Roseobacter sp.]|uniref:NepR family anti-sigma factor n=1 Tax=Roseobacter sp. TaxID=1907202 RepID=UPI003858D8DA
MDQHGANRKRESVIDENLKRVFEETLEEGIPDRFRDLLDALKRQDNPSGSQK